MAKATIAMLEALRPDVIFDRSFLSWWAYGPVLGHDVAYMPRLAVGLARVDDVRVVLLTATAAELQRRFAREPDGWFSVERIVAANERFLENPLTVQGAPGRTRTCDTRFRNGCLQTVPACADAAMYRGVVRGWYVAARLQGC